MKLIKQSLLFLSALVILLAIGLWVAGHGYIFTAVARTYLAGHATANINDHTQFNTRVIKAGEPQSLSKDGRYNQDELPADFKTELQDSQTAAFLILKDGKIVQEHYFNGYDDRSRTNSFSMAKTVLTLMLGIAIEEGHVQSLEQPITDFIPEFKQDEMGAKATVGQMSLMNSGYEWTEHYYTPFSPTVQLLYGSDITDFLVNRHFSAEPGTFWEYSSASTQLLGIFLLRALKQAGAADTLSEYLSEKLWRPMGMNDDALWHLDENNMELVYCCINSNARNFAKLGQLMLQNGVWNNEQLVPEDFVQQMITPAGKEHYGLSTWLGMHKSPAHYLFSGHLGQYIIVVPEHNLVVVRLGESSPEGDFMERTAPDYVQAAIAITQ